MVRRSRVQRERHPKTSFLKVLQVRTKANGLKIRFQVAHDKLRNIATRADHELEMVIFLHDAAKHFTH